MHQLVSQLCTHIHHCISQFWLPAQHPMLAIMIGCIMGIILQSQLTAFILLLPIAHCVFLSTLQNKFVMPYALTTTLLLFFSAFLYERQIQNHTYIRQQIANTHTLTVKIIDKEHIAHNPRYKEWIIGEIQNIALLPNMPFSSPWKIYMYQTKESNLAPGDNIEISNLKNRPTKENDFASFLCKEGVAAALFLNPKNKITLLHRPAWSITHWLWQKRKNMLSIFENNTSCNAFELASCIFWGNRTIIKQNPDARELFKKIGIVHYLARSGLHLIIFIFIWQLLLKAIPLSFRKKQVGLLFAGITYLMLSWPSISFLRAFFLFVFFVITTLSKLRTNIFYLLCLTCTLFLISNPIQLFFLDFQLTFGLTCALVWHNHVEYQIKLKTSQNH